MHRRHSLRLPDYDYSSAGAYFITLCTYNRKCLFGEIFDGVMHMNPCGNIAQDEWLKSAAIRKEITLDEFIIMPNHLHGIIFLADARRGTVRRAPTHNTDGAMTRHSGTVRRAPTGESFGKPVSGSLPTIIRSFKSAVTRNIRLRLGNPSGYIWQRNYYERVIRHEKELAATREYIANNPLQWALDRDNPINIKL